MSPHAIGLVSPCESSPRPTSIASSYRERKAASRTHARAQQIIKKRRKAASPHTGARSQAHALKGEGKGELHAGCKGERGGDAYFPLQKRLMGNISNSFLIRCACSFNALESNFLKTIGVPTWVWIYTVRTQNYHMKSQR